MNNRSGEIIYLRYKFKEKGVTGLGTRAHHPLKRLQVQSEDCSAALHEGYIHLGEETSCNRMRATMRITWLLLSLSE